MEKNYESYSLGYVEISLIFPESVLHWLSKVIEAGDHSIRKWSYVMSNISVKK